MRGRAASSYRCRSSARLRTHPVLPRDHHVAEVSPFPIQPPAPNPSAVKGRHPFRSPEPSIRMPPSAAFAAMRTKLSSPYRLVAVAAVK